jgi:GNAT superfamily N-acetyltransferase
MNTQKKIIRKTEKFRVESKCAKYPPYHEGLYLEEYFYNYFIKNNIKTDILYLPIFWTNLYNNSIYNKDVYDIQSYLNTLDPNLRYFTVCQHVNAPREILPPNIIIFSAGGGIIDRNNNDNYIPIPLISSKIKYSKVKKDIFCSFVGAKTHNLRNKMFDILKNDEQYYIRLYDWNLQVNKKQEKEFKNITKRSIFSLCPRGTGPTSFRLYEAIQLGTIPIYVSNKYWLPYADEINWNDICIFVTEKDLPKIKNILNDISEDKIKKMKKNIVNIYTDPEYRNKGIAKLLFEEAMKYIKTLENVKYIKVCVNPNAYTHSIFKDFDIESMRGAYTYYSKEIK